MFNRICSLIIAGAMISVGHLTFADTVSTVAKFTNTKFPNSSASLNFVTDDQGVIHEIRWDTGRKLNSSDVPPRHKISAVESGTVLETYDAPIIGKLETIRIRGGKVKDGKATWVLSFLNNANSSSYIDCPIHLQRSAAGGWQLNNSSGKPITVAKIMVGSSGVDSVQGLNCKPEAGHVASYPSSNDRGSAAQ